MAESSLSISLTDLQQRVSAVFGYGNITSGWNTNQQAEIDAAVHSGMRQFYFPMPGPGQTTGHRWSFLRPVTTLLTVIGQGDYDLPGDFGGIDGPLTFQPNLAYKEIQITGEQTIRQKRQTTTSAGWPVLAAIQPRKYGIPADEAEDPGSASASSEEFQQPSGSFENSVSGSGSSGTAGAIGQRFRILFWPTPNAAWLLTYRYIALTEKLSVTNPYPLGGMAYGETILASCLAAAERQCDAEQHTLRDNYKEMLAASIQHDSNSAGAEYYGYNADRSDHRHKSMPYRNYQNVYCTYNNVLY